MSEGIKRVMKKFIKEELQGWKKAEVIWLLIACGVIAALSIYWKDTLMGIISSTTGVACVVCTGKGKRSAYIFGLVNSILYAIIAYNVALYGETMLNAIYYVPMQFIGFYVWSKNMNQDTHEVVKKHMKNMGRILMVLGIALGTVVYGLLLKKMGDSMPFVDAFTTVSSVVAMVVSVRMFAEQWWIWLAVDLFTIYMWGCNFLKGQENIATLLMWIIYLGNAVIMCVKWEKEIRGDKKCTNIK